MCSLLSFAFLYLSFTSALVLTPVTSDTMAKQVVSPNLTDLLGSPTGSGLWKSATSANSTASLLGSNTELNESLMWTDEVLYSCNGPRFGFDLNIEGCASALSQLIGVPYDRTQRNWIKREFDYQGTRLPRRYMSRECPRPSHFDVQLTKLPLADGTCFLEPFFLTEEIIIARASLNDLAQGGRVCLL